MATPRKRLWIFLLIASIGLVTYFHGDWLKLTSARDECVSVKTLAQDLMRTYGYDAAARVDLQNQIDACDGVDLDETDEGNTSSASPSSSAASSSSTTPSTQAQPSAPAIAPRPLVVEEFYTERPAKQKVSVYSYGPKFSLHPALNMRLLESLTLSEFVLEDDYRIMRDRSLTSASGAFHGLWSYDQQESKLRLFMKSRSAWRQAIRDIQAARTKEIRQGAEIQKFDAGWYDATWFVMVDGVPHLRKGRVYRNQPFQAYVTADGRIMRLACGFQQYWRPVTKDAPPDKAARVIRDLPPTVPGIDRTPEGTPRSRVHTPRPHLTPSPSATPTSSVPTTTPSTPSASSTTTPSTPTTSSSTSPSTPPSSSSSSTPARQPDKTPSLGSDPQGRAPRGGGRGDDSGPGQARPSQSQPTVPRSNPAPTGGSEQPGSKPQEVTRPERPAAPETHAPDPTRPASGTVAIPD